MSRCHFIQPPASTPPKKPETPSDVLEKARREAHEAAGCCDDGMMRILGPRIHAKIDRAIEVAGIVKQIEMMREVNAFLDGCELDFRNAKELNDLYKRLLARLKELGK